jgi:cytochrome c-type biogenesis protein CcmH/NrfG
MTLLPRSHGRLESLAAGNRARDLRAWCSAATHYQRYLELHPNDFAIWVQLGHALKEQNRLAEAIAAYDHAYQMNDADADLCLNLGHSYFLRA